MKRRLFLPLLLFCLLLSSVCAAEMTFLPIEQLWEMEDARTESQEPLFSFLSAGSGRLGYDRENNTFYCTIGTELSDEWPDIRLTCSREDVSLYWVDDYRQDSCADAVAEGYAYEAAALNDGSWYSFSIVFTGLPLVSIVSTEPVEGEYVSCSFDLSAEDSAAVHSSALTHLHAGGPLHEFEKLSYRVELHTLSKKGKDRKNRLSLLGMDADSDWLLLASPKDDTCIRSRLGWELWNEWFDGAPYAHALHGKTVELFVNERYEGVYTLMQRIDIGKELKAIGGSPDADYAFRFIHTGNLGTRPTVPAGASMDSTLVELRSAPEGVGDAEAFSVLADLSRLSVSDPSDPLYLADEEFTELVRSRLDTEEILNLYLFLQLTGLDFDNVENNLYIYAVREADGNLRYHIAPWDLDQSILHYDYNGYMPMIERILDLNIDGARDTLLSLWNRERSGCLSDDAFYARVSSLQDLLNRSGAYRRETLCWKGEAQDADFRSIQGRQELCVSNVRTVLQERWFGSGDAI